MKLSESILLYIIILIQIIIIMNLAGSDEDTISVIRAGHKQIISALELNSCFHLEIPPDTLDETGKKFK